VFITAGFQVPLMPLFDVVCNAGAVAFWHKDPIGLNVGVVAAFTVIGNKNGPAH
jgi:hypothetical protein